MRTGEQYGHTMQALSTPVSSKILTDTSWKEAIIPESYVHPKTTLPGFLRTGNVLMRKFMGAELIMPLRMVSRGLSPPGKLPRSIPQLFYLVRCLPGEIRFRAAEVAVGGGLAVDGS